MCSLLPEDLFSHFILKFMESVSCSSTEVLQSKTWTGIVFLKPGPELIKLFSCSTPLSMNFLLLINVKMPTVVGILTFMSGKNRILGLSEPKKSRIS